MLQDKSTAASKAAILSALAAFDSDDDERDDTYDTADVGGTVDANNPDDTADGANKYDEVLFKAYKSLPKVFDRDAATRRGRERAQLRSDTGMTDETIEGWGLMLSRDQRQMRRLEAQFSTFGGAQQGLVSTAWRATPAGSGDEEEETGGGGMGRGNREWGPNDRGRGGRLMGQGRGLGSVAGPTGNKETEEARRRKDASKGSRANHNRRDQRAKKMARGAFPS